MLAYTSAELTELGTALAIYNQGMARGWESKSVEAQMEESSAPKEVRRNLSAATPDELARRQKHAALKLSRSRTAQQMETSTSERYSEMLRRALEDLDQQIAALEK